MQLICFAFSVPLKKTNLGAVCDISVQTADYLQLAFTAVCLRLAVLWLFGATLFCSVNGLKCNCSLQYAVCKCQAFFFFHSEKILNDSAINIES